MVPESLETVAVSVSSLRGYRHIFPKVSNSSHSDWSERSTSYTLRPPRSGTVSGRDFRSAAGPDEAVKRIEMGLHKGRAQMGIVLQQRLASRI